MDDPAGHAHGIDELVRRGDLEELMLEVDRRCAARDWDGLVSLRDRCEAAIELGRQLWGVARFAEYRLALEAPGPVAGSVCHVDAARFTLGPLTEVAASTHSWDELADHLPSPWAAASVAQERVLRGEDLRGDDRAHPEVLDLPLTLRPWEPDYPLPRYRSHDLAEGGPTPPEEAVVEPAPARGTRGSGSGAPDRAPRLGRALRDVVATWVDQSEGSCAVSVVAGDAADAAADVAPDDPVAGLVPAGVALENLVWAAASGGAYGRRRGMAAGRSAVFWILRVALGLGDAGDPLDLDAEVGRLRWFAIGGGAPSGWRLRLAVDDPIDGWGAAIVARDEELERQHGDPFGPPG